MKYLQFDSIENINSKLSCIDTGDARIFTRLEAYSCKNTGEDRKLKSHIEGKYTDVEVLSPTSPFGPLSQVTSRKTLFYLLGTLNSVFPDYDFSDLKPESFHKVPGLSLVTNRVANMLLVHLGDPLFSQQLGNAVWESIDEVVQLSDCDVYSWTPDRDSEPEAEEGNLWSFYYFFFNRRLKRMVFFTARSVSMMAPLQPEEKDSVFLMSDSDHDPMNDDVSPSSLSYEQFTMHKLDV